MVAEPTPKDRLTGVDLRAIAAEAQRLIGRRLEKAFDLVPAGLGLVFREPTVGRTELWLVPGRYAALVPGAQEHAEGLSPLAQAVRRAASGAALQEVTAPPGERYLELRFGRAADAGGTTIAAELFGTGNLVLARDEKILAVAHVRRWAQRELRPGAAYRRPPAREDPFVLGAAAIESELVRSRTDLASTLAARLSLGGPVAEEILARGGWDPAAPAAPNAHAMAPGIHAELAALLAEVGAAPRGFLVRRGEELLDTTPYRPRRWATVEGVELIERPTYSETVLAYFAALRAAEPSAEESRRAAERAEVDRLAARQREALGTLATAIDALQKDAEAVYAEFGAAEAGLGEAALRRPRPATIRLRLSGREVELPVGEGAQAAAQGLYEEAKRLAAKREGAATALRATEERLAALDADGSAHAEAPTAPPAGRRAPPRWFERFRWFVSSEGALVLGGRDAGSNDLLVRRHLHDGDLYVHADLHGAASVVVKRPSPGVPAGEATIREAAQWAVAFSKAWRAGLASATAFWASPDQVSKSAASGEFVPRGAWMVRGTKHFVPDLPLELAIGPVRYEKDELLSVAPLPALRARGTARFLLAPGEERERDVAERELARELGVARSRLQGLLPAGGIAVRRA